MSEKTFKEKHKEVLIQLFRDTIQYLEENNYTYISAFGTVLGAVRHKGLIPWDDDIDIYMPRKDYNRLFDCKQKVEEAGFGLISLRDPGYYLPFGKIYNPNTTLVELEEYPTAIGVYIDIFPIDEFDGDDETILAVQRKGRKIYARYRKTVVQYSNSQVVNALKKCDTKLLSDFIASKKPFINKQKARQELLDFEANMEGKHGEKCMYTLGMVRPVMHSSWFHDLIDWPYEGFSVKIPREYDAYLSLCYGNYLQIPPEDQRESEHKRYYINLKESLTMDEIRQRINNGEREVG